MKVLVYNVYKYFLARTCPFGKPLRHAAPTWLYTSVAAATRDSCHSSDSCRHVLGSAAGSRCSLRGAAGSACISSVEHPLPVASCPQGETSLHAGLNSPRLTAVSQLADTASMRFQAVIVLLVSVAAQGRTVVVPVAPWMFLNVNVHAGTSLPVGPSHSCSSGNG